MNGYKTHIKLTIMIVLSSITYYTFAYNLLRTDTALLIGLYTILFICFWQLLQLKNYKLLIGLGVLFRVLFLFPTPNLSQDFYRFIWDGRMLLEGFNPYLYTPESFLINNDLPINQAEELYEGMGKLNGSHFTNYPPINQLCFVIAGVFAANSILGSVIVLRVIIIATEIGIVYFGSRLLGNLKLTKSRIFWYFLNPFIIIELTGNLHFEAVMLFFLIWSLYQLQQGKWQLAAVIFGLSVSTKLIPLLFLPLVWQWFISTRFDSAQRPTLNDRISTRLDGVYTERSRGTRGDRKQSNAILNKIEIFQNSNEMLKQSRKLPIVIGTGQHDKKKGMTRLLTFYIIVGVTVLLTFLPFYNSQFITNYSNTVALWFNTFEFNASIYYLAREIGYLFRSYNEIAIIGKLLSVAVFLFVIGIALFRTNKTMPQLLSAMLLCFSFYLFFSTTVHPWYVSSLVLLSLFTNYKFPLVWSFVIILSYFSYLNIGNADKSENLYIILIEYFIVFTVFLYDLKLISFENLFSKNSKIH